MKCPKCGKDLRKSPTEPNMGLCDSCMMKFDWIDGKVCQKCGSKFDGNFCPNCGTPANVQVPTGQYNYTPNTKPNKTKKKRGCLSTILIVLGAFFLFIIVVGMLFSDSDDSSDSENKESKVTSEESTNDSQEKSESKDPELNEKEYKKQCEELDYKAVSRNPDDYVGKKFKVTVQIFSASENSSNGKYYKAYTDDGSGVYFDNMIWIFDKRDENSDGYVKLLEEDIVTFYGEFEGMQETENVLNGEKGEDVALNIYFADLIEK